MRKVKSSIKRRISYYLTVLILIAQLITPMTALAGNGEIKDNKNKGGGDSSYGSGGGYGWNTWNPMQSGYRITIIDKNFKPVSKSVDIWLSEPSEGGKSFGSGGRDFYTNPRTSKKRSNSKNNWVGIPADKLIKEKVIDVAPPQPIAMQGGRYHAQGDAFKEWFLAGNTVFIVTPPPPPPPPAYTPKSSNTGNRTSASKKTTNTGRTSSGGSSSSGGGGGGSSGGGGSTGSTVIPAQQRLAREYSQTEYVFVTGVALLVKDKGLSISEAKSRVLRNMGGPDKKIYMYTTSSVNAKYIYDKLNNSDINYLLKVYYDSGLLFVDGTSEILENTLLAQSTQEILELDPIPLSKKKEGYAYNLLEYKLNGKYVFDFKGRKDGEMITVAMARLGYDILVEPVFWFQPRGWAGSGPSNTIHPNYIYGTAANIIDFHKSNPKFGGGGGAYSAIVSRVGWRCLFMGNDYPQEGKTMIKGYNYNRHKGQDSVNVNTLYNMLGDGIGMHVYLAPEFVEEAPVDSLQTTRDKAKGSTPHPAPNPSKLETPTGDSKQYKIVKYYEIRTGDSVTTNKYVRNNNPPSIRIEDEPEYVVENWFITNSNSDGSSSYEASKKSLKPTRSDSLKSTVKLNKGKERALHVQLVRKETMGDLILRESEITKGISTMSEDVPGWGARKFKITVPPMAGNCKQHSNCKPVAGSLKFLYSIVNTANIDRKIIATGNKFNPEMFNSEVKGDAPIYTSNWEVTIDEPEMKAVLWRGDDIPTIASYKETDKDKHAEIKKLLGRYGKVPVGSRRANGSYNKNIHFQLGLSKDSITKTRTVHSANRSQTFKEVTHKVNNVTPHKGTATVKVYRGENKPKGDATNKGTIVNSRDTGKDRFYTVGQMIQNKVPIKFYPYVRMSYQFVNQAEKSEVYVLSNQMSEILPNDFVEIRRRNNNPENSLIITSTQWSTHQRAVNGGKPWNGHNQVLPGGAIYFLGNGDKMTFVDVITWQTIVDGKERGALAESLPDSTYTLSTATKEHNSLATDVKDILSGLRIVQWVTSDLNAKKAWSNKSKSVKITEGGESLKNLGLNGNASTDGKYHLRTGTGKGNSANLEIMSQADGGNVFYKLFADTEGNVYLATSLNDIDSLKSINGDNIGGANKILSKSDVTESQIVDKIRSNEDAYELEMKTKAVTNFVKTLVRNKGNDVTRWASDGKWYNEAWDGIYVVRKQTTYGIGLDTIRATALDPKLCPPSKGRGDLFSKAFMSQFAVDELSTSEKAKGKAGGYMGTFKGHEIYFRDGLSGIYESKKFYIPNVNVMDLH